MVKSARVMIVCITAMIVICGAAVADELGIVHIHAVNANSIGHSISTGSHLGEGWVLTCGHCVRSSATGMDVEIEIYSDETGRATRTVPGTIVYFDRQSDIGLIRLRPGHALATSYRLAPRGSVLAPGDDVIGFDWVDGLQGEQLVAIEKKVTYINRYLGPENIETTVRPKGGSSGGPLVLRDGGWIVGVTQGALVGSDRGLYVGLEAIYRALENVPQEAYVHR